MEEGWLECPWSQAIRKAHTASSYSARQHNLGLVGPSCLSSAAMSLMSPWTHCEPRVSQLLGPPRSCPEPHSSQDGSDRGGTIAAWSPPSLRAADLHLSVLLFSQQLPSCCALGGGQRLTHAGIMCSGRGWECLSTGLHTSMLWLLQDGLRDSRASLVLWTPSQYISNPTGT